MPDSGRILKNRVAIGTAENDNSNSMGLLGIGIIFFIEHQMSLALRWSIGLLLVAMLCPAMVQAQAPVADLKQTYDVVIYGGTSGGVIAAVQTVKLGKTVLLIEPGKHLGGLTAGGLGATDIGNKQVIGGLSRDFYHLIWKHYQDPKAWRQETAEQYAAKRRAPSPDTMWTFEPHAAEAIMDGYITEFKIPLLRQERLDLKAGVKKSGAAITEIKMESGKVIRGKMFIDATYEGDLMALAGVKYHVGREANAVYGETLNGVQVKHATKHQFNKPVSAYRVAGDKSSGLLPGVHGDHPGEEGAGDKRVQAYNFRLALTNVPENQIPFPKPAGYDPLRYELLLRYLQAGVFDCLQVNNMMPNHKTDTNNNGAFSSDNIGMNYDYPDGDYATREKILQEHITYHQGMLWFLANDPRVPEKFQSIARKWGLSKDEFKDNGGWPHQMYVREARRMIGPVVMTQAHCQGREVAKDSVGMGAYNMDSHNVQRYVDAEGNARNEGDIQVGVRPYSISYQAIVPIEEQCNNLLVPVCLSASHISYGSIRMEPVFMVLGQSAATAACQALDAGVTIQKIDYAKLREKLLADGQVLEYGGGSAADAKSIDPTKLAGVVIDTDQAKLVGDWNSSSATAGYVGGNYLHDDNAGKGKSATFVVPVKQAGMYKVRLAFTKNENRATNVPVTITYTDQGNPKTLAVKVNQREATTNGFARIADITLTQPSDVTVTISNEGANGHVIVDAVQID
jgi:hypothetical protein